MHFYQYFLDQWAEHCGEWSSRKVVSTTHTVPNPT